MKPGVIELVNEFRSYLRRDDTSSRVAPLELSGRIEDYLVREFMQCVYWSTHGAMFCEFNLGSKGEQKVDVSIVNKDAHGEEYIQAFLEAKYLQNRGRRWAGMREKYDEIRDTIRKLAKQLRMDPKETHGGITVRLGTRFAQAYGLIFVGYTRHDIEPDESGRFLERIVTIANEYSLRGLDLDEPYLVPAFVDKQVNVMDHLWSCSLWIGLWRGPEST